MKKFLTLLTIALSLVLINHSCKPKEEEPGSIYGVVTDYHTLELLPNVNVKLYKATEFDSNGSPSSTGYKLLTSSITASDGSFEFNELEPTYYRLDLTKGGYHSVEYSFGVELLVEEGKVTRVDLTLRKGL